MNFLTIILIAIGLAMDATAVSIANGIIVKKARIHHAFRFAFSFAFFQMIMPLLGWYGSSKFLGFISTFDHWVAFGLLAAIGSKMIYESFIIEPLEKSNQSVSFWVLMGLSVATSIDALAVGVSFAVLSLKIIVPVIVIGIITFLLSLSGFLIGGKVGHLFERKIEFLGGIILIAIGIKILLEHLM